MAAPEKHSILGASAADRWMHCPPSARLTEDMEDAGSSFAAEGTAAHALAEYKVCCALHLPHGKRPHSDYESDEMEEATDSYCEFISDLVNTEKLAGNVPSVAVEEHVEFGCYVPGGFGQCDFLVVSKGQLHVCDFKFGKGVAVYSDHNPQMMLYALGALEKFDCIFEVQMVTMTIFQPRIENISTWSITADELRNWAENELKPKAELADKGEGEFSPGAWCRFCKARNTCRARADNYLELARLEFKPPALLSDEEIAEVMKKADELNRWCSDLMSYVTAAAINDDRHFEGYKVVRGKANRKFTDMDEVEKAAKEAGFTDIYTTSLIPLTAFEKLMGKKFNEVLGRYVTKAEGKLTLVPVSDKRPEIATNNAQDEFKED